MQEQDKPNDALEEAPPVPESESPSSPEAASYAPPAEEPIPPTEEVGLSTEEQLAVAENQARRLWDGLAGHFTLHKRGCYLCRTGGWCIEEKWVYDIIKPERGVGVVGDILVTDPPRPTEGVGETKD